MNAPPVELEPGQQLRSEVAGLVRGAVGYRVDQRTLVRLCDTVASHLEAVVDQAEAAIEEQVQLCAADLAAQQTRHAEELAQLVADQAAALGSIDQAAALLTAASSADKLSEAKTAAAAVSEALAEAAARLRRSA